MASRSDDDHRVGTRGSVRSTPRRQIPQEVWNLHREEIKKRYIDDKYSLKQVMSHMRRKYGFDASPKQWKDQLKIWKLAKNISQNDAAHILQLYNEAESSVQRQVFFHGQYKSKGSVLKYVRKSKKLSSLDDLLSQTPVSKERPSYITYHDSPRPSPTFSLPQQKPQSDESVDVVNETEGYSIIGSVHKDESTSKPVDNAAQDIENEESASEADNLAIFGDEEGVPEQHITSIDGFDTFFLGVDVPDISFSSLNTESDVLLNPIATVSEGKSVPADGTAHGSFLTPMMSVTPWEINGLQNDIAAEIENAEINKMLGLNQGVQNLNASQLIKEFLWHACKSLIYYSWPSPSPLGQALQDARSSFDRIMQYQPQWTLTAMNNVHFLMDLYGHRELAHQILQSIGAAVASHWPSENYISQTADFMVSIRAPTEQSSIYDLQTLSDIYDWGRRTAGPDSPLTLTAQYNLAWATLEQSLKPENEAQKAEMLDQARELLESMTERCNNVFGKHQIQSINCIATLARVHLMSGQIIAAEYVIDNDMVPTVKASFAMEHPFYWESNFRQAVYKLKIAKSTVRLGRQEEYWQHGMDLLLSVLRWRRKELGRNNPHTTRTAGVLWTWLTFAQNGSDRFKSLAKEYQSHLESINNAMCPTV